MVCSFFRVIRADIPFFNRKGVLCRGVMLGALLLFSSLLSANPVSAPNRIQMRPVNTLIGTSRVAIQSPSYVVHRDFRSSSAVPAASYNGGVFYTTSSKEVVNIGASSASAASVGYSGNGGVRSYSSSPSYGGVSGVAIQPTIQWDNSANVPSNTIIVRPRGGQYHAIGTTADLTLAKFEHSTNSPLLRAPSIGGGTADNGFDMWLLGIEGDAFLFESGGVRYYDQELLRAAFEEAIKSGNMPGLTWEQFLAWFNTQGENPKYSFPIGDIWSLLVLAVGYLLWMISKKQIVRS